MKALAVLFICWSIAAATPAAAEFYKYVDDQGRVRFTDDINQVPAAQRAKIKSYVESKGAAGTETKAAAGTDADPPAAKPQTAEREEPRSGADPDLARIQEMKRQLESELKALTAEKEALTKEKEASRSREEIMAYNKKVEAFNQHAEQYEKLGQELKKTVHDYNTRLVEEGSKDLISNTK